MYFKMYFKTRFTTCAKKNVAIRVTMFCQSYDDDEKCKCRACRVFRPRHPYTFHPPRSIFSWTRSNLFIAYYISRNSCHYGGLRRKIQIFIRCHSRPSPLQYPPIYICLFQLYRKWICGSVFPRVLLLDPEYTTHATSEHLTVDRAEQYFRSVYTTPAARVFAARAPANITSLSYFAIPFYLR